MKAFVSQQYSFQITHHTVAGGIYHYHNIGIWSSDLYRITQIYGLPWQLSWLGIHLHCRRPWFDSRVRKIPWRRDRLPTPVFLGFPGGSDGRESIHNEGDLGLIPVLGRSPRGGHGNPLQYSYLENPMDRGAWWAIIHGVTESDTTKQLSTAQSDLYIYTHDIIDICISMLTHVCTHALTWFS